MAASDYDFVLTRTQIIEGALKKVGAYYLGDTIPGEEMTNAANCLNALVKEWQTKNVFLWQLQLLANISCVAGQEDYSLGSDPGVIGIDKAFLVNGNDHEQLKVISWRTYQEIPDKTTSGEPQQITIDKARGPTAYVYPVPPTGTTKALRVLAIVKLQDWDNTTSTGDFPEHWSLALQYGLADILADDYGLPISERKHIAEKASYFFSRAKGSDRDRQDRVVMKGAFDF